MTPARPGFTLLEVILALAIAVLLLGGLYAAINVQMRHAQGGRDLVEQNTLARSVLNKMAGDVSATVGLGDAARFRLAQASSSGSASGGTGTGTGSTGASGAAAGGAASTGSSSGSSSSGSSSSTSTSTTAAQDV